MMKKEYRDKIKENFVELVNRIEPHVLLKFLISKHVITKKQYKRIITDRSDVKHINRSILFQVLHKHDSAYFKFLEGLDLMGLKNLLTNHNDLRPHAIEYAHASVFHEPNNESNEEYVSLQNLSINSTFENENRNVETDRKPLIVRVKLSKDFKETDCDNSYYTKSSKRGQVLIINNRYFQKPHKKRKGSEFDVRALETLFEQMGLKVQTHKDLDESQMKNVIAQFAKFADDKISDICVVIIMSHGEEREKELTVIDKNNRGLKVAWIEEQFTNVNCSLFSGKPKVFLYQFCRGAQNDYATTRQATDENVKFVENAKSVATETDEINSLDDSIEADSGSIPLIERRLEDMLIGFATLSGHRAHRDPNLGSWYIQLICEVFMEKAHNTHIVEMLNEVDRKLRARVTAEYTMQTSSYTSNGFNKFLYFNPGIYLDDSNNVRKFV